MDSDFSAALAIFKEYFSKYDQFVKLNPRIMAEVEAIIRWSSYLVATRKSPVLGELLSSGANLLQLCNDIIIRSTSHELKLDLKDCATQLKTFLSVLQSLELLAEIYARENFGPVGKWAIITVIQIAKAAIKLILLLVFEQGITKSQSFVPLDRLHFTEIEKLRQKCPPSTEPKIIENSSKSLILKSSGRKMRLISESPAKMGRFNESSSTDGLSKLNKQRLTILLERYREHQSATLTERQLYGELLHVARPITHLALMGALGTKSWLAYFTALAMDVSSLHLVRSPSPLQIDLTQASSSEQFAAFSRCQFTANERMELGQRASSLLLYLLRSPFFDEYTKTKALSGLATSAESIPLVGNFIATFFNYIPDWQKDYFRVWSE